MLVFVKAALTRYQTSLPSFCCPSMSGIRTCSEALRVPLPVVPSLPENSSYGAQSITVRVALSRDILPNHQLPGIRLTPDQHSREIRSESIHRCGLHVGRCTGRRSTDR